MREPANRSFSNNQEAPFPEKKQEQTARHLEVGRRGEDIACRFFWKKGFRIIERNRRSGRGEIDLIAEKNGRLYFVEVKTRTSETLGPPEERVDQRKRERLRAAANAYLNEFRDRPPLGFQFDVVSVYLDPKDRLAHIERLENAF